MINKNITNPDYFKIQKYKCFICKKPSELFFNTKSFCSKPCKNKFLKKKQLNKKYNFFCMNCKKNTTQSFNKEKRLFCSICNTNSRYSFLNKLENHKCKEVLNK